MMFTVPWPLFMEWARFIDPFSGLPLWKSPRPVHTNKISEGQSTILRGEVV
jgi:hypothetical protein